ncbi:hypothetical protein EYF80_040855 [Liparis tanakae]|uniref:Uncharacterized protein n=1 Tax=Liparis tanakae TaxID=230148 RepID=A0A4Z2G767_9TELE|nr:hypothetical protein EYF80_040855 [Liparis tanakae]
MTFVGPIAVIIVLYMRVFVAAVSQARAMRSHIASVTLQGPSGYQPKPSSPRRPPSPGNLCRSCRAFPVSGWSPSRFPLTLCSHRCSCRGFPVSRWSPCSPLHPAVPADPGSPCPFNIPVVACSLCPFPSLSDAVPSVPSPSLPVPVQRQTC